MPDTAINPPPAAHCDWCGEPFADGEKPVLGYEDKPTHKACAREALKSYREDQDRQNGREDRPFEREPFNDWPNGQGTYD